MSENIQNFDILHASRVRSAIRRFFGGQDFTEVETPILQICPTIDTHIHGVKVDLRGVDLQYKQTLYLQTSPEFEMKKLLSRGFERIYQLCKVFRDSEFSPLHNPEFTMLEWYRTDSDYRDIMQDCVDLIRTVCDDLDVDALSYQGQSCDPFKQWEYLSVVEAFERYASIDLNEFLDDIDGFRAKIRFMGLHASDDDQWDDLFFRIMDDKIEPHLGFDVPTFLYDYPVCMASLSRKKPEDERYAERFELYVCGVELANAFSELTDAKEQRERYIQAMDEKESLYGERYPVDEDFLGALEAGMPESGGIALGVDRLVMLLSK